MLNAKACHLSDLSHSLSLAHCFHRRGSAGAGIARRVSRNFVRLHEVSLVCIELTIHCTTAVHLCVCVCVRARVRACACVRACVCSGMCVTECE